MNLTDASDLRLINQQIASQKFIGVSEITNWMGAFQAQDFPMSEWAIGIRLHNITAKEIDEAFNRGEILRTHLLRPTLHLVSSENIRWLLALTATRIKAGLKSRHKELELTGPVLNKSNNIIRESLKGANHLTREELFHILIKNKIAVKNQRGYHILVSSELDGIICSGALKGGRQTYALLNERVPETTDLTKEEALGKIGRIFFSSRGPATVMDFKWWSGLSTVDAGIALEIIKPDLISEKAGPESYWFSKNLADIKTEINSMYLLPAFDEFLISYKDRSASLRKANFKKAVSDNGIFRPVIVRKGHVIGIWKRIIKSDKVIIEPQLFRPENRIVKNQIEICTERFGHFLGKITELK